MSKYRQKKTLKEHERITDNLNQANNVALILNNIYSMDALENYLGFWRPHNQSYAEEGSDWEDEEETSDKQDGDIGDSNKSEEEDDSDSDQDEESSKKKKKAKAYLNKLKKQEQQLVMQLSQTVA